MPTGSPYAVGPGRVRNQDGGPYRVFTPFARAWREHGWSDPAPAPRGISLGDDRSDAAASKRLERSLVDCPVDLPTAGEDAALRRWRSFRDEHLSEYADDRDRPDRPGTSRLSPYLKVGAIHPRTMLADLSGARSQAARTFVDELAWREFYADVLHSEPPSAWRDLRPALRSMTYDEPDGLVDAWKEGRTGFPIVDAGMRQLAATGWMHNRVRMITASFLCKDLHVWWPAGARHFLDRLIDGDLASNNHGWQWVAGTGTDASPYFRVFNPVTQGEKFDPDGALRPPLGPRAHAPAGPPGPPALEGRRWVRPRLPPADGRPRGGASGGPAPVRRRRVAELVRLPRCRSGGPWTTSRRTSDARPWSSATSTGCTSATSTSYARPGRRPTPRGCASWP